MDIIIIIMLLGLAAAYVILHPFKSAKLIIYLAAVFLLGLGVLGAMYLALIHWITI